MTNSSSVQLWTLRMPAGSLQQWLFTMTTTAPGGTTPYPLTGVTGWEYVVRAAATDTGIPLFSITTTPNSAGALVVTATDALSQVLLDIYPAATATLTPGTYAHSLWMGANTNAQFAWITGLLVVEGAPQP